jgi:hypothetical protein
VGFDAPGFSTALALANPNVLFHVVHAFDKDTVLLGKNLNNATLLPAVTTAFLGRATDDLNEVTLFDLCHG